MAGKTTNAKVTAIKGTKAKATTKKRSTATKRSTTTKKGSSQESAPKRKGGRPKAEINQRQFEDLCRWHCTRAEVAAHFDVDESTITRWCKETYGCDFATVIKKKEQCGNTALRKIQFNMAENGSERMAIWLGKQWLGQTDKQEIDVSAEISAENRREIEEFLNDNGTNTNP